MGHVTPGYEFAVVDKDTGELCAEGETGELWLRGTRGIQLFLEYFDNDEANAKAFEDGWFKTGDMVMLGEGGNLFYHERDKDLLKVGGENVSAREVEELVVAVPGVSPGRRSSASSTTSSSEVVGRVRDHGARRARRRRRRRRRSSTRCRDKLADFKVPRAVYVVDEFPPGTLDKILKNKLREMADEHPPVD